MLAAFRTVRLRARLNIPCDVLKELIVPHHHHTLHSQKALETIHGVRLCVAIHFKTSLQWYMFVSLPPHTLIRNREPPRDERICDLDGINTLKSTVILPCPSLPMFQTSSNQIGQIVTHKKSLLLPQKWQDITLRIHVCVLESLQTNQSP